MKVNKRLMNKSVFLSVFLLGLIIYCALGVLATLEEAYAHSLPVTESPAPDSIIKKGETLPSKIIIDFSERPDPNVSTITVLNTKNERVSNGDFVIIGDNSREAMATLDSKKLADGVYSVSWMTQSLDDGHIARGSYVFGIGNVGLADDSSIATANGQNSQIQAVTSNLDGLLKWPVILSQATIVGCIFSHFFLWERFGKKLNHSGSKGTNPTPMAAMSERVLKRFSLILLSVSGTIIAFGTVLLFLQLTELTSNNASSYYSVFISVLHGPSGLEWLIRVITSTIVAVCAICFYQFRKKHHIELLDESNDNRSLLKTRTISPTLFLYVAFIAGSVSIFTNSVTSHNAAVNFFPTIAIIVDWLHFMGVSVWVGGLFYISCILLNIIREMAQKQFVITTNVKPEEEVTGVAEPFSYKNRPNQVVYYYLALLLPRFSLLATVSLGVIGITGLYMGWLQLHSLNSLFSTPYGNILIVKLCTALPLILLGSYHQLNLHRTVVAVTVLGTKSHEQESYVKIDKQGAVRNNHDKQYDYFIRLRKKLHKNRYKSKSDIAGKFEKTIKIESLLAIIVLLFASLLSITSPGSMNMSMSMSAGSMDKGSSINMQNNGMHGTPMANSMNTSYIKETKILNVDTRLEISPFKSGFNTFKVSFIDPNGKPYSKISAVRMIFKNDQADIGPITVNLKKITPGIYSITGGYLSQPGEWNIALAAQRPSDYDLNYRFTSTVNQPNNDTGMDPLSTATKTNIQTHMPPFDGFAILIIALSVLVGIGSAYFYKKSKQELTNTSQTLNA